MEYEDPESRHIKVKEEDFQIQQVKEEDHELQIPQLKEGDHELQISLVKEEDHEPQITKIKDEEHELQIPHIKEEEGELSFPHVQKEEEEQAHLLIKEEEGIFTREDRKSVRLMQETDNLIQMREELSNTDAERSGRLEARTPRVYIIGDSCIHRGENRAKETVGINLGLHAQICWFGFSDMGWRNLLPLLRECLQRKAEPDVLVIHCGGNDIGIIRGVKLVVLIKQDLTVLHHQFPRMRIIFSTITQRCHWTSCAHPMKMNKSLRFVNSVMTTFLPTVNGAVVHHRQISHRNSDYFLHDGVHFSPLGNDVFF